MACVAFVCVFLIEEISGKFSKGFTTTCAVVSIGVDFIICWEDMIYIDILGSQLEHARFDRHI